MAANNLVVFRGGGKKAEPPKPPTELDAILAAVREVYAFDPVVARGIGVMAEGALRDYNSKRPTPLYDGMLQSWGIAPGTRL